MDHFYLLLCHQKLGKFCGEAFFSYNWSMRKIKSPFFLLGVSFPQQGHLFIIILLSSHSLKILTYRLCCKCKSLVICLIHFSWLILHCSVADVKVVSVEALQCIFLCQLTCQSADIMSSLCGVGVRVRMNNFFSKTTRPRDMLFFLKDTLSIEDEKVFKACKSVCPSVC